MERLSIDTILVRPEDLSRRIVSGEFTHAINLAALMVATLKGKPPFGGTFSLPAC
jgi:hypothetical protein